MTSTVGTRRWEHCSTHQVRGYLWSNVTSILTTPSLQRETSDSHSLHTCQLQRIYLEIYQGRGGGGLQEITGAMKSFKRSFTGIIAYIYIFPGEGRIHPHPLYRSPPIVHLSAVTLDSLQSCANSVSHLHTHTLPHIHH